MPVVVTLKGLLIDLIGRRLYAVRCLKSREDMILALAGQFKQLSHEPEKNFSGS